MLRGVKKCSAGRLDGWIWAELKALPMPWFSSGLALILRLVESSGVWLYGILDACIHDP